MGKSSQQTNEATKTEIDPQLKQMYMDNYSEAKTVGQGMTTMGPYTGQRVAGPTDALNRGADMIGQSSAAISGEIPPWASGQTVKRAEGWLNDATGMAREEGTQMQAYGYDPTPFWMQGATLQPSSSDIYRMDRAGVRDMATGATPRENIRDVNAPNTPRELIRDVNNPNFDRSLIRDVNNPNFDRSLVRDVQFQNNTPRELVRDINPGMVNRGAVRDINGGTVDRGAVRDIGFGGTSRGDVRDVSADSIAPGMGQYQNAYTDQVIDRGLLDLNRARKLTQQQNGASAVRAGAFGGARQAILEGETNRGFADATARMTAEERSKAFTQAGVMSQADRDARLSAAQANQGQDATMAGLRQQGVLAAGAANQGVDLTMAQMRQQAGMEAARANQGVDLAALQMQQQAGMEAARANQGADLNMAGLRQQAAIAEGTQNQAADINMAGLRQQGSLAAGTANQAADMTAAQMRQQGSLAAGTANQAADINAAQMRQQAALEAGKSNQAADLSAADMYQRGILQAGAANQSMDYQTALASMGALNAGGQFNANLAQQANAASAGYGQQAAAANQAAALNASQFNATQKQQASGANQQARFQSISQMLQAAQQAQSLAQMQYQLPMDAAGRLMGLDQYSRGITNEQLQAAMQAWDDERYRNLPAMQLASSALGMQLPNLGMSSTGNSKTTYSPSGLQTIGQIAGLAGMFMK